MHLKLTHHCKSTIPQQNFKKRLRKKNEDKSDQKAIIAKKKKEKKQVINFFGEGLFHHFQV